MRDRTAPSGKRIETDIVIASLIIASLAAVATAAFLLLRNYRSFRSTRLIICPETGDAAAVKLNAGVATETSIYQELPDFRLSDCSRWPERAGCDEACLTQIDSDPEGSRVRNIVQRWYAGQVCVLCRQPIQQIDTAFHVAALVKPGFQSTEWKDIRPENLPEALDTAFPVCWSCHVTERFYREHRDLVTERPPHRGSSH